MGTIAHCAEVEAGRVARRFGVRLPAWKPDERAGKKPDGDWHELPARFSKALKTAADFADRHPSAGAFFGVLLDGCHAYATNKTVLVEVETGGAVPSAVIPLNLVQMLIKRKVPPAAMLVRRGSIAFAWDDATWIEFASRHKVPAIIPAKLAEWREPVWQIPASWKEDFRAVASMAGDNIVIGPESISGAGGQTEIEVEADSPVAQNTIWCPKILAPVIKLAERIDFTAHPKGGCFAFPGGRGLVAGRAF